MTPFSSLSSNEQSLLMLMSYFHHNEVGKTELSVLASKIMSPAIFKLTLQQLLTNNMLYESQVSYNTKTIYADRNIIIPAIVELFKTKNKPLLKSIRSLFQQKKRLSQLDPLIRLIVYLIAEKEPEAVRYSDYKTTIELCYCSYDILDDRLYKPFFSSLPDDLLLSIIDDNLLRALLQDKQLDWDYLKELIIQDKTTKKGNIKSSESIRTFAFYYYLGTGKLCIDLHTSIANAFTLQIAAIGALYKDDYSLAYKLYTKALAAHNKQTIIKGTFTNPISNYYFALAAIFVNTESSLQKLRTMANKKGASFINLSSMIISPLRDYFCDKKDPHINDIYFMTIRNDANTQAVSWLTWILYQRLGKTPKSAEIPPIAPNWAYLQLETCAKEEDTKSHQLQELFGGTSLFNRLKIKSAWQLRLESLLAENQTEDVQEGETEYNTKLIYILRYGIIVPILKRKLKNGSWSVGRELSIQEFKSLDEPCFDSIDQNVKTEISTWEYSIYIEKYLYLFIDCDHIYIGNTNNLIPVAVHLDKPHLIINKQKDGSFSVSTNVIELERGIRSSFFFTKNTETDYSVFTPTQFEYKTYKEILTQASYPAEAEPYLVKLITAIGGKTEIHSNMVAELDSMKKVDVSPCIILRIVPDKNHNFLMTASVRASESMLFVPGKGNITTIAEKDGQKVQLVRNLKKEREYLKAINEGLIASEVLEEEDTWTPQSINEPLGLSLLSLLPFIEWCKEHQDICTLEWAEGCKINYHPNINSSTTHISFKTKNGWFEVEGNVQISEGQVISLQKLLELMRQNYKQKFTRIGDNEFITLSSQLSRILKRLDTVTTESRSHLQMAPTAVSLIGDLLDDSSLDIKHNEAIDALRKRIETCSKEVPVVPKTLQAQLRDYQEEGFEWMSRLTAWGAGVCLADDMGLGKTVQTITLLLEQSANGASLIVAPASVVPNWRNELKRFAPTLNLTVLNQSEDRSKDIKEAKAGDVIIITYALLNIQQKDLTAREWNIVCLDEAHTIKNANTKMSKAAMQLQAQRKVILTGTPIQNHLAELWNLFQFINPGLLGSAEQFKQKFILPIEGENDKNRQNQLRRLISPFLLRRTKAEVIDELPAKNEIKLPVELSSEEMAMYEIRRRHVEEKVLDKKADKMIVLAEITRLRQMACSCSLVDKKWKLPSSKVLAFIDLAESLNDSGNRALVFSQFTSFFEEIKKAMDTAKLPYLYLDGSTPMAMREKLVKEFQSGKCPFFLISLKAGGLGLNLTGANYVIHLDPWWNPAIEQQATDRAYRIGQQQDVTVYHLISQHTIEEKILRLHKTKRNLSDSLLEGSDISHALTQEELLEMLQDNR